MRNLFQALVDRYGKRDRYGNDDIVLEMAADEKSCSAKFEGRPWFSVSMRGENIIIDAFDGIHLSDVIRLVENNKGTFTASLQKDHPIMVQRMVVLKGGARGNGEMASNNIDFFDRVWFSAEKKTPNRNDEVLVEIEQGEMLWCVFDGKNYISSGSPYVQKGQIVKAYNWAWTYE